MAVGSRRRPARRRSRPIPGLYPSASPTRPVVVWTPRRRQAVGRRALGPRCRISPRRRLEVRPACGDQPSAHCCTSIRRAVTSGNGWSSIGWWPASGSSTIGARCPSSSSIVGWPCPAGTSPNSAAEGRDRADQPAAGPAAAARCTKSPGSNFHCSRPRPGGASCRPHAPARRGGRGPAGERCGSGRADPGRAGRPAGSAAPLQAARSPRAGLGQGRVDARDRRQSLARRGARPSPRPSRPCCARRPAAPSDPRRRHRQDLRGPGPWGTPGAGRCRRVRTGRGRGCGGCRRETARCGPTSRRERRRRAPTPGPAARGDHPRRGSGSGTVDLGVAVLRLVGERGPEPARRLQHRPRLVDPSAHRRGGWRWRPRGDPERGASVGDGPGGSDPHPPRERDRARVPGDPERVADADDRPAASRTTART